MNLEDKSEPLQKFRVQPTAPARALDPLVEMNSLVTMGYRRKKMPMLTKSKVGGSSSSSTPYDFFSLVSGHPGAHCTQQKWSCRRGGVGSQGVSRGRASPKKKGVGVDVVHYLNGVSATKKSTKSTRDYVDAVSPLSGECAEEEEGNARPRKRSLARLGRWVSFGGSGNQPWYGKSQEYYSILPREGGMKWLPFVRFGGARLWQ